MTLKAINIYIPTLNAGSRWGNLLEALGRQTYPINHRIIVDSGSVDDTVLKARSAGFKVLRIAPADFDHGGTRQLAVEKFPDADIYVFLTQDAIPADERALASLIHAFDDPQVGIAYGRQLPNRGTTLQAAHARLFNYPPESYVRKLADAPRYGIKTIFCSNSFAAYRRSAFEEVGGFPEGTIMGEDMITAGRLLLKGWKIAYAADALVYHSHAYTLHEEFNRYFDIGVFHRSNPWIFESFGDAGGEGWKYVKSEMKHVGRRNPFLLPRVCGSLSAKWLGYQLGLRHLQLPTRIRRAFSMYKRYWDT